MCLERINPFFLLDTFVQRCLPALDPSLFGIRAVDTFGSIVADFEPTMKVRS